jgi:Fe2+ transport system protein FeoA
MYKELSFAVILFICGLTAIPIASLIGLIYSACREDYSTTYKPAQRRDPLLKFDVMPVRACKKGTTCWVEFLDCGPSVMGKLRTWGITPGAQLEIVQVNSTSTFVLTDKSVRVKLGESCWDDIIVRVIQAKGQWSLDLESDRVLPPGTYKPGDGGGRHHPSYWKNKGVKK